MNTPNESRVQPVAAHTPTPWSVENDTDITSNDYRVPFVASTHFPTSGIGTATEYANAAFIVRACNSHAALVEALADAEFLLRKLAVHPGDALAMRESMIRSATAARSALAQAKE